jgi:hypothetical protein
MLGLPLFVLPTDLPVGASDPFVSALIERYRRNVAAPDAMRAVTLLSTAELRRAAAEQGVRVAADVTKDELVGIATVGGWCAPPEPLACGCPMDVLETAAHQPGCTVLDIPAEVTA